MGQKSLLDLVKQFYPEASNNTIREWISLGRVSINGKVEQYANTIFNIDTSPTVTLLPQTKEKTIGPLKVVSEDRSFIAINKPPALLSVPASGGENALALLRSHYQTSQIFPVHRIDRETSGLMIFAKGMTAKNLFSHLFETHAILRYYAAILEGRFPHPSITIENYLKELESFKVIPVPSSKLPGAKKAITHLTILKQNSRYSHALLQLETGRKHQIRVHCSGYGHPVLGDHLYGNAHKSNKMMLHALSLSFIHPFRKNTVNLKVPIPSYFTSKGYPDPSGFIKTL